MPAFVAIFNLSSLEEALGNWRIRDGRWGENEDISGKGPSSLRSQSGGGFGP